MIKRYKPVTIKDIARRLNLHHSTVSRALRNHPNVSPETRELVLSLAEELDYHPNTIALNFKYRKSNTIGVILPDVKDVFFAYVLSGIEDVAHKSGYYVMITQSNESYEREVLNVRALISNQVCGVLVCISQKTITGEHFEVFKRREIPLVFFGRVCDDIEANKIVVDDFEGAFKATEYLIKTGHKRIGHLTGPQNLLISQHRLSGYKAALEKYNIPFDEEMVVSCSLDRNSGANGFQKLWFSATKPDAIFAVNDLVAIGAYMKIKEMGLKIPDEISLIGFGDNPDSVIIDPPLTTIGQEPYEMGKTAANILVSQIENPNIVLNPTTEILPTKLIIRKSVALRKS